MREATRLFVVIAEKGTEDVFEGNNTARSRRTLPASLHGKAAGLLDRINAATQSLDLRVPNANRLEKLTRDRAGQWSVRINDQYRICFRWSTDKRSASKSSTITSLHEEHDHGP